jgi:hypothetical protein
VVDVGVVEEVLLDGVVDVVGVVVWSEPAELEVVVVSDGVDPVLCAVAAAGQTSSRAVAKAASHQRRLCARAEWLNGAIARSGIGQCDPNAQASLMQVRE